LLSTTNENREDELNPGFSKQGFLCWIVLNIVRCLGLLSQTALPLYLPENGRESAIMLAMPRKD